LFLQIRLIHNAEKCLPHPAVSGEKKRLNKDKPSLIGKKCIFEAKKLAFQYIFEFRISRAFILKKLALYPIGKCFKFAAKVLRAILFAARKTLAAHCKPYSYHHRFPLFDIF
jgi:hypothetical protein